jgi:hypothetical protein
VTDLLRAALRRDDPRPVGPGRVVAHMLVVAAFELSDPVLLLVLVEPNDPPVHSARPLTFASSGPLSDHSPLANPAVKWRSSANSRRGPVLGPNDSGAWHEAIAEALNVAV